MKKKHKIILSIGIILSTILAVVAALLAFSAKWMFKTWTNLTMDELVYHLTAPLDGTNADMIKDYCNKCAVPVILILNCIIFFDCGKKQSGFKENYSNMCHRGSCGDRSYGGCNMAWSGHLSIYERTRYILHIYR
ncbi:hypothetical protein [Agathobacter sp.]|uniref:hypothetical protein n=1 Tax=Agathobacter sp. TaxID=2021311 RepID=UPI003FD7E006